MINRGLLGVAIVAGFALSACGATPSASSPDDVSASNINVATPGMVAEKATSKVEPCPAAQTTDGGLPKQTLPCLGGGRAVDLATLKGPLIINIFQSACGPCLEEAPAVAAFYKNHGAQYPMLGVDGADTVPGAALSEAIKAGITYPLVADPGNDLGGTSLNYLGYPTWYFLAADGTLTTETGPKTSEAEILAMATRHFGLQRSPRNTSEDLIVASAVGVALVGGGALLVLRRRWARSRATSRRQDEAS